MSVILPINRIRLGNSEVETPDLFLRVTNVIHGENAVVGMLDGSDDLILSVLEAHNGKANIGDRWIKFRIENIGDQVQVQCDERIRVADIFKLSNEIANSY